ncbi:MAG: hypothetical protein CMJ77_08185 [Planctomycetaceae bacterium]|nr:hypothetical protein [Planctomycetaceae bacterium]
MLVINPKGIRETNMDGGNLLSALFRPEQRCSNESANSVMQFIPGRCESDQMQHSFVLKEWVIKR